MAAWIRSAVLVFAFFLIASPAAAQDGGFTLGNDIGKAIGMGIVVIGGALGIGRIGGQAVEGMSRQPESSNNIQTAMLIAAALIEGAVFAALVFITFLI